MADQVVFANFIAEELDEIEMPLVLQEIVHNEQRWWVQLLTDAVKASVVFVSTTKNLCLPSFLESRLK